MERAAVALLVAVGLAAAPGASAQTLYKWIDAQGRVQYSDKPPKDFKGEVTRIEADEVPPPVTRQAPPRPANAGKDGKADIGAQRRLVRERLTASLERAQERVAAARRALDEAGGPTPEEHQVIQQRVAKGGNPSPLPIPNRDAGQARQTSGGMHGMTNRSNCREAPGAGGRKVVICPTVVPGEAYRDRIRKLEEDLAAAEAELAEAQSAYRRGVD